MFAQVDPVDVTKERLHNPVHLNPYLYANGNPLKYVDPDGRVTSLVVRGSFEIAKYVAAASVAKVAVGAAAGIVVADVAGEVAVRATERALTSPSVSISAMRGGGIPSGDIRFPGFDSAVVPSGADDVAATGSLPSLSGFTSEEAGMIETALQDLTEAGYETSPLKELIRADMPPGYRGMSLEDGAALGSEAFSSQEMLNHVLEEELRHVQQALAGLTEVFGPGTAETLEKAADEARKFPLPE